MPPPTLVRSDLEGILWISLVLLLSVFFGTLRAALQRSHPARVLGTLPPHRRARYEPLLERADRLAASAAILKITSDLVFVTLLVAFTAQDAPLQWTHLLLALGIAAPSLMLLTEALPLAVARARGDRLLLAVLPTFHVLQLPVALLVIGVESARRAILRVMGLRDDSSSARKIVEGLRDVIEDASISGDLHETEREIIENVMEFRDVDVAAVMTPRTEIHAVDVENGLAAAIEAFGNFGHSRIPVYEESIDTIIGTINALEVTKAAAQGALDRTQLRDALRPAYFVPETKHVSELLVEFRTQKQKIAIVLDEYGGTAGLVTLGDLIAEIVGDIQDEYQQPEVPMRELEDGVVEVQGALHVTEVNEALDLDIPESEDFETLAGFVLAELGHFPREGESFVRGDVQFSVAEASDRRVLRVLVKRSA